MKSRDTADYPFSLDHIELSKMISNTLDGNGQYPCAVINTMADRQKTVALICNFEDSDTLAAFQQLEKNLEALCIQHEIKRADSNMPFIVIKNLTQSHGLYKCAINISPYNLEKLFMYESEHYSGYREGGSISRLVQQGHFYMKADKICLYPIHQIDDHTIMLRNAGCQMSETIAVQVSHLLVASSHRATHASEHYGHHNSPLVEDMLGVTQGDLLHAARITTGINHSTSHQETNGIEEFHLSEHSKQFIYEMDETAIKVYRALTATFPDEIPHLKSVEMPIVAFLENLSVCLEKNYQQLLQQQDESQQELDLRKQAMTFFNYIMSSCAEHEKSLLPSVDQLRGLMSDYKFKVKCISALEKKAADLELAIQADCLLDNASLDGLILEVDEILEIKIASLKKELSENMSKIDRELLTPSSAEQTTNTTKIEEKIIVLRQLRENSEALHKEITDLEEESSNLYNEDETTKAAFKTGLELARDELKLEQQLSDQLNTTIDFLKNDIAERKHNLLEKMMGVDLLPFLDKPSPTSSSLESLKSWLIDWRNTINNQALDKTSMQAVRGEIIKGIEYQTTIVQSAEERVIHCQGCQRQMAQLIEYQKTKFSAAQAIVHNSPVWQISNRPEPLAQPQHDSLKFL